MKYNKGEKLIIVNYLMLLRVYRITRHVHLHYSDHNYMVYEYNTYYYFPFVDGRSILINVSVCVSVCLPVRISDEPRPKFTKYIEKCIILLNCIISLPFFRLLTRLFCQRFLKIKNVDKK